MLLRIKRELMQVVGFLHSLKQSKRTISLLKMTRPAPSARATRRDDVISHEVCFVFSSWPEVELAYSGQPVRQTFKSKYANLSNI